MGLFRVAVVTGSGRGLGFAYARAAAADASVVINDVDADAAVEQISDQGGRAVAEVVAVGTSKAPDALVNRAVSEFGRLDVMVANAGVLRDLAPWKKMSDDDFDTVQHVHLSGTFTCVRAAAVRVARAGRGRPHPRGRIPGRAARQLRPHQLSGRVDGHRRDGPHLGHGTGEGRQAAVRTVASRASRAGRRSPR